MAVDLTVEVDLDIIIEIEAITVFRVWTTANEVMGQLAVHTVALTTPNHWQVIRHLVPTLRCPPLLVVVMLNGALVELARIGSTDVIHGTFPNDALRFLRQIAALEVSSFFNLSFSYIFQRPFSPRLNFSLVLAQSALAGSNKSTRAFKSVINRM